MGVLFMPVVKIFSEQAGGNFEATLLIFALPIAILLPADSPYAAVLCDNKDWICQRDVVKYGVTLFVMGIPMYSLVEFSLLSRIY